MPHDQYLKDPDGQTFSQGVQNTSDFGMHTSSDVWYVNNIKRRSSKELLWFMGPFVAPKDTLF